MVVVVVVVVVVLVLGFQSPSLNLSESAETRSPIADSLRFCSTTFVIPRRKKLSSCTKPQESQRIQLRFVYNLKIGTESTLERERERERERGVWMPRK